MLYCNQLQKFTTSTLKVYSILFIEHSDYFADLVIKSLIHHDNYIIQRASSAFEAKKLLQNNQYDFIIFDLDIPSVDGEEFFYTLKQLSSAKIIILTAEMDVQMRETLFKKGILDYMVKDKNFSRSLRAIAYNIASLEKNRHSSILVIEDSTFMAKQLQNILQIRNYDVYVALRAEDGLEILKNKKISAIILDMELPDKHGLELLHEIKELDDYCHIPALVISAAHNPEVVRSALKIGASDFIKKPFNIEEFLLKVDMAVETNRRYTEMICSQKMLHEYKMAIDESALVSKTNPKGIITYVNDAFCKLSGYTREELVGKPHNIVRDPDMDPAVFREMWETILSKKTWKGVIKNRAKNGLPYYVQSTIVPIVDADNNIVEFIAIRVDITENESYKKILEDELNISNNNLAYLHQYEDALSSFVATIKTNSNNKIIYVNENFCKLSGYSESELLGRTCNDLRSQKHRTRGDCDSVARRLRNKSKVTILFENVAKDGHLYYTDTHIFPLFNSKGEITDYLHLMYDVTEMILLHQDIENTQKEIIYKMGEIGETRSQETGNHVKRVAEYSRNLALFAGMSEEEADLIFTASPMHDIGKVGISDAILKKPGRLSDEEFAIMKRHAEIGFNILKGSKQKILKAAAVIAFTHHEKYDGTGYPKGTKGEKIHIFGRITAIADVFDALGSDRYYKKAWEIDKILKLMKEERGKHFDPKLIDIFFEHLDTFLQIRENYKDLS